MAVAKKKSAPSNTPRVSALAAAVRDAAPQEEKNNLFDYGDFPEVTFLHFRRQDIVPGKKEWACATFDVNGEERAVLFCIDSQSLASTGPRIKSMAMAIIGTDDEEAYNAFDPHGEFIDGLLGDLETFESGNGMGTITPADYEGGTKLGTKVVKGKETKNGDDNYRNHTFYVCETAAAE